MAVEHRGRTKIVRDAVSSVVTTEIHTSIRLSACLLALFTLTLLLPQDSSLSILQAVLGFTLLSFVPGLLLLHVMRERFRPIDYLYAVVLSAAVSTFIGWIANVLHRQTAIFPQPFVEVNAQAIYIGVLAGLTVLTWYATRDESTRRLTPEFAHGLADYDLRIVASVLAVPVLAVCGALLLNRTGENVLVLSVIGICAALPILALVFDTEGRYFGLVLVAIAFALILQRAIVMTHLAFGDGIREYSIARGALELGYWVPVGTMGAMPRIWALHPMYALMMDIPLLWEFKIVHPLLFAVTPLLGYKLASRYFAPKVAFLGTVLYVFLPETYRLLPRNTRTGTAILFTVALVAVVLDSGLEQRYRSALAIAFFWGAIASHYGIGPLLFLLLVPPYLIYFVLTRLGDEREPMLGFTSLALFGVIAYAWYASMTGGPLTFVVSNVVGRALNFTTPTSNTAATNALSFEMPSLSYEVLFYSHLLVAALTCLSIATLGVLHFLDVLSFELPGLDRIRRSVERDAHDAVRNGAYLSVIAGLMLLFPLSFGPNILSSARTFGFLMVFGGPFAVLAMRLPRVSRGRFTAASVFLVVLLLATSGFMSATVTHDASRVPNFDRERIIESGDRVEQFALYRVYNPESSVVASAFVAEYIPDEATVYKSSLGTYQTETLPGEHTAPRLQAIQSPRDVENGYVYISEADTVTGTMTTDFNGFVYYEYFPLPEFAEEDQVYTNGRSRVVG